MSAVTGTWRIIETELWDPDDLNLVCPAFIEFGSDETGRFAFVAVEGDIDYRDGARDGHPAVEFSWDGIDEGDPVSGRGWAALGGDGLLRGRIYFHHGDDSGFRAMRIDA